MSRCQSELARTARLSKMTVTYSVSENEEESTRLQDHMKQVMDDYNQEFGTHFAMADLRGFNTDINNRLAKLDNTFLVMNSWIGHRR